MSAPVLELDFWSDDIKVGVLTPLMILRAQEPSLRKKTKGILQAKVETVVTETRTIHNLNLIAPALGNYKEKILSVAHKPDFAYPCEVNSVTQQSIPSKPPPAPSVTKMIYSQTDFVNWLKEILQSPFVRSAIDSLLAKSNEMGAESATNGASTQPADSAHG